MLRGGFLLIGSVASPGCVAARARYASSVLEVRARRVTVCRGTLGAPCAWRTPTVVIERGPMGRLRGCELFAVKRTESIHCRMELERGFPLLAHDNTDGIAADFDDVGL